MNAQKPRGREGILSARIVTFLVFATLLLSAPLAQAVPITIEITGEITYVGGASITDKFSVGDPFTGSYTYDSQADDSDSDPQRGVYEHDGPYGITISVGVYEFKTASGHTDQFEMRIINDDSVNGFHDQYIVYSHENVFMPSSGLTITSIRWDLWDSTYDAISSDALPLTAPVLSDWDWDRNVLDIDGFDSFGKGIGIKGIVTHAIPEPLTGVFLTIGVLLLIRRR